MGRQGANLFGCALIIVRPLSSDRGVLLDLGAGEADDDRDLVSRAPYGVDYALRDPIAAVDAGEHVDEDRLDVLVGAYRIELLRHAFRRGAAADQGSSLARREGGPRGRTEGRRGNAAEFVVLSWRVRQTVLRYTSPH